jgi:two-component system, OmpR family, response regulator
MPFSRLDDEPAEGRGHLVLIVEDEPSVRWILALAFQGIGLETDVAESGRQAIELLKRRHGDYCAVLLDLNVPRPDGLEIAAYIRDFCDGLPVIVVSGYPDLVDRIKDAELSAVIRTVSMKPVDTKFLVDYVHGSGCIRTHAP